MRCFVLLALFAVAFAALSEEECQRKAGKCFEGLDGPRIIDEETCLVMKKVPDCLKQIAVECAQSDEDKAEAEASIKRIEEVLGLICAEPCVKPADILPALSVCIETLEELDETIGEGNEEEDNSIDIEVSEADAECILGAFLTECAGEVVEDICGDLIAEGFKESVMEALFEEGVGKGSELCKIPTEEKKRRHVMRRAIEKSTVFKRFAKYRRSSRK